MNIEAALTRRVPAGAKLHTGRSRNDQVALDMRLWLREEIVGLLAGDCACSSAPWCELGERQPRCSSRATPTCSGRSRSISRITCWPMWRCSSATAQRLQECLARVNVCPLGSGALAGSTLPLDRELVAKLLGFVDARGRPRLTQNSMDAVSDRDFVVEYCGIAALLGGAPVPAGRGPGAVVQRRVQLHPDRRRLHHRLIAHAAEEESRRGGTHAGQERAGHRQPRGPADAAEGPADDLQPRPAGGQGAAVRHRRHRAGRACGSARPCSGIRRVNREGVPGGGRATRPCWRPTWPITWSGRASRSARRTTRWARSWRWPRGWASP